MGRNSKQGSVTAKGNDRIQFDFRYNGIRYKPSLPIVPTERALQLARERLKAIKQRIANGSFDFREEFPDYRFLDKVSNPSNAPQTFREVALSYLRSIINEEDYATVESFRKIIGFQKHELYGGVSDELRRKTTGYWLPWFGDRIVSEIGFFEIKDKIGSYPFNSRKTRNNVVSVGRLVFNYAKSGKLITASPMEDIKSLKVQKAPPDPYTIAEAEMLLAGLREDCGDGDANYFEFSFFTGLRPSEAIALQWRDVDRQRGTIRVHKARVMGRNKGSTKTSVERTVELNPRAMDVLRRQYALTGLKGENVFGHMETGRPYHDLQVQWKRWQYTHKRLGIRYREPYQTRHSSVTWNLMAGKNFMWVAKQHGHSYAVMLGTYAKWLDGSTEEEVEAIKAAMGLGTTRAPGVLSIKQFA